MRFLSYLAKEENVAVATQNQALNALVLLYREILGIDLGQLLEIVRPVKPKRLPSVLTRPEIIQILKYLKQPHLTIVQLMYGAGLRVSEVLRLRVMDIDFGQMEILVRSGKGGKTEEQCCLNKQSMV